MNDRAEVCPLSRRAMSQPVSRPLQPGIRFLRIPLPTAPTAFLAVRLPLLAGLWAYPVPHEYPSGADPSASPAVVLSMMVQSSETIPHRVPFWFKPVSTFGLFKITTLN
jgi:hypothetical protein